MGPFGNMGFVFSDQSHGLYDGFAHGAWAVLVVFGATPFQMTLGYC